jgi:hypothetical protein
VTGAIRARFAPWSGAIELDTSEPANVLAERVLEQLGCSA